MQQRMIARFILIALCAALLGCGGDEAATDAAPVSRDVEQGPVEAELVVEASEARYTQRGESMRSMALVESILTEDNTVVPPGYVTRVDEDHQRAGQRLIRITPTPPFEPDQATADEDAGKIFEALKVAFEAKTQRLLNEELAFQKAAAESSAEQVKERQQTMQAFQQARRTLPQTDASRLELRKLDRQYETALQAKIEADKRVEDLQQQIDRNRHVKLLRVR